MRLIDYDKLHEQALDIIGADASHKAWAILSAIDNAPTIKLPKRKRGRWIYVNGHTAINCSACYHCSWSALPFEDTVKRFNFCPNCGADMRGVSE